ncbi:cytochrome P450 3A8-like, partial [Argonauta hians]
STLKCISVCLVVRFGRRNVSYFKHLGIPGPTPIAHLGNLTQMGEKGFIMTFTKWREEFGDLYGVFIGTRPTLIVADPEYIQEILVKKFSCFVNRLSIVGDHINNLEILHAQDEHWKFLRTVIAPSFTAHQLRGMTSLIQTCADHLKENIGTLVDSGDVREIKQIFSAYTTDVISTVGFGIKVDSQKEPNHPIVGKAREIFNISLFSPILLMTLIVPSFQNVVNKTRLVYSVMGNQLYFRKFCEKLIQERKKCDLDNAQKNLLNLMIKAQIKGHETLPAEVEEELQLDNMSDWKTKRGMTDDEILAQSVVLFLAGYETTSSTLNFFTYLMATNSDAQEKLYQEIIDVLGEDKADYDNLQNLPYLNMCLDETLRIFPVATAFDRVCNKTCTINGTKIPEGLTISISAICLHRNPKYWPEPDKFIPERFSEEGKAKQVPFSYLPFGGGPRICLGMRLAKLKFKIAAVEVIRNFKILPTEKTEIPLTIGDTLILQAKNGVWVKFERR